MDTPHNNMRYTKNLAFTCILLAFMYLIFVLYQKVLILEGLLRVVTAVTPGVPKSEVQQRLNSKGEDFGSNISGYSTLTVPPGGDALRFDSYMTTWLGDPMDFVVVFDRQERVVGYEFVSQKLGWDTYRQGPSDPSEITPR